MLEILLFFQILAHIDQKNGTNNNRRVLYYTYSLSKYGSKYQKYFHDKEKSKNPSKALVDK